MKPYPRAERVAGSIQKNLSEILRKEISDPRLKQATITGVKMTSDLRLARVYFATDQKNIERATAGFQSALGFIKKSLAKRLDLRYMPDLQFFYDASFDYAAHIEKLLKSLESDVK